MTKLPSILNSTDIHSSFGTEEIRGFYFNKLDGESLFEVASKYLSFYANGDSHTAKAKRYDLERFLKFLAKNRKPEQVLIEEWTLQSTKDFIDSCLLVESPATVSRRLATIKHFGRTLAERVPGYINPSREAKNPTQQATKPSGLNTDEINLLLQAARISSCDTFNKLRNRFLLELLLATGLRADEVRLLVMNQVSQDLTWLKNVRTKGKKFRQVYLNSEIRDLFSLYLEERNSYLLTNYPAFATLKNAELQRFPVLISIYQSEITTPSSFSLSPKSIWRIIANFGKIAQGFSDKKFSSLHPHKLRHTFAHGLLDSSKDIRLVAQALGHSDVRTTMRYTERTNEEIAQAIEEKLNTQHVNNK
jgi:site-specific recombinase XerD